VNPPLVVVAGEEQDGCEADSENVAVEVPEVFVAVIV
jgi:hypothetical protein